MPDAFSLDPPGSTPAAPTPPTPEQVSSASATIAEVNATLNDPTIPSWDRRRPEWVQKKNDAFAVILAAQAATADAQQASDAARVESMLSPDDRTARILAEIQDRHAEIATLPKNHPRARQLIDEVVLLTNAKPGDGRPRPGTITDADLRDVTRAAGLTDLDHVRLTEMFARLDMDRIRGFQFCCALRDAPREDLSAEEVYTRAESWWGGATDANLDLARRTWDALTHDERLVITSRRASRDVMQRLVEWGKRMRP